MGAVGMKAGQGPGIELKALRAGVFVMNFFAKAMW